MTDAVAANQGSAIAPRRRPPIPSVETADALCRLLPGSWKRIDDSPWHEVIEAADGGHLRITVGPDATGQERVCVQTWFVEGQGYVTRRYSKITVALSRGAEALAREVQRRLLPLLEAEMGRVRAEQQREAARRAAMAAALEHIDRTLPSLARPDRFDRSSFRFLRGPGSTHGEISVDVMANAGSLTINCVPLDQFQQLTEAVGRILEPDPVQVSSSR